jgi:predicted ATPase/DNA-binding winged helix-turn-helix (wHTH) protein
VVLGGRAFDILVALIERRGTVVRKDELIGLVWPGRIVEENTLEAQMSAVRRALGEDRDLVRTVSGRGYQFIGDLLALDDVASLEAVLDNSLPESVTSLIGREADIEQIALLSKTRRLITLVGAGGVGKTRLAIEVAHLLASEVRDGASLIELGPLRSAEFIAPAVAQALGFPQGAGTPSLDRIANLISAREMLLVLDNCEHVVEAAAHMAEALLQAGSHLRVIATSREPLRAAGEYVYRVPTLTVPSDDVENLSDVLRCSALQLFQARAGSFFALDASEAKSVSLAARICRRLDGIPLAIELAASRVPVFGLEGVASRIDDCFSLLTGGTRTALPRQQTLRATLDWSYELLSADERIVLARLSLFTGPFLLEGAVSVASGAGASRVSVVECLATLVAKSLVSVDGGTTLYYRLLETTRIYAREKLAASGALREFSGRHAQYYLELMQRAEADWETLATDRWTALYSWHLDGVRAAVEWSFSAEGAPRIGIALTTSAIPIWTQMGLLEELLPRVEAALSQLGRGETCDAPARMKLSAALGAARLYQGVGVETASAFSQALAEAEHLGAKEYQLRGIWGLWSVGYLNGRYSESHALARRFAEVADSQRAEADRLIGDRMTGMSLFCLGRLEEAREHLGRVVAGYKAPSTRSHLIRFIYEQRTVALSSLAHVLWLRGFADQAAQAAAQAIDRAQSIDHPPSVCYALTEGVCAISVLCGGVAALVGPAELAVEATRRHGISTWKARGQMWLGLQRLGAGDAGAYKSIVLPALNEIGVAIFVTHHTGFISAIGQQLGAHGLVDEAHDLLRRAIDRAEAVGDRCSAAELMRVRGDLYAQDRASGAEAEAALEAAMAAARHQQSLAWKLRCATSLARVKQGRGKVAEARALLGPVYAEFTEGFASADLVSASRVLEEAAA